MQNRANHGDGHTCGESIVGLAIAQAAFEYGDVDPSATTRMPEGWRQPGSAGNIGICCSAALSFDTSGAKVRSIRFT
jgi:hypothetical protein